MYFFFVRRASSCSPWFRTDALFFSFFYHDEHVEARGVDEGQDPVDGQIPARLALIPHRGGAGHALV